MDAKRRRDSRATCTSPDTASRQDSRLPRCSRAFLVGPDFVWNSVITGPDPVSGRAEVRHPGDSEVPHEQPEEERNATGRARGLEDQMDAREPVNERQNPDVLDDHTGYQQRVAEQ